MGKAKKSVLKKRSSKPYSKPRTPTSEPNNNPTITKKTPTNSLPPTIPFEPTNRILLVGEGDFSFSSALLTTHACTSLIATAFDPEPTVISKYPQAASHISALTSVEGCKVLYGIDATKIGKGGVGSGGKATKKGGFDRIVFNFPHVGGLTKDVYRQVRHNQELLQGFFKAAQPLLAVNGTIVVTVFEGEPYEQWNLRALAKDAGMKVQRSFRFQAEVYPGYRHTRTLGTIKGDGGWRGEERKSRTLVFEVNDWRVRRQDVQDDEKKWKRKRGESYSEDD